MHGDVHLEAPHHQEMTTSLEDLEVAEVAEEVAAAPEIMRMAAEVDANTRTVEIDLPHPPHKLPPVNRKDPSKKMDGAPFRSPKRTIAAATQGPALLPLEH